MAKSAEEHSKEPENSVESFAIRDEPKTDEPKIEKDEAELELEKFCFSQDANLDFEDLVNGNYDDFDDKLFDDPENLFVLDTVGSRPVGDEIDKDVVAEAIDISNGEGAEENSLWVDEDDSNIKVNIRKTKRLRKLRKYELESTIDGKEYEKRLRTFHEGMKEKPAWASKKIGSTVVQDQSILASDTQLLYSEEKDGSLLQPDIIDIFRCKNANVVEPQDSVVQTLDFHPHSNILLVAGFDRVLRLFAIDGVTNEKIQSIAVPDLPISTAKFTADGKEVIISGKRKYFYVFNLVQATLEKIHALHGRREMSLENFSISPCNRYIVFVGLGGSLLIVCRKTKQYLRELRMNTFVRSMSFSQDGKRLYSNGGNQQIYVWNMDTFTCDSIFNDEGCIKGTAIAVSRDLESTFLAAGSESGIVNVYKKDSKSGKFPRTPIKALTNLTTYVDGIQFNCDNQMMAMYSRTVKNSLRLVHFPSLRVYSNWPTMKTPLRHVQCIAFSPRGEFLAVGNDKGHVMLLQMSHYLKN